METTEDIKKEEKSPFEFSVDWHLKHAQSWLTLFETHRPKRAIEIGCYEGMSSVFLLDHAKFLTELVCMDTWDGGEEHKDRDFSIIEGRFDKNVAAHKKGSIVKKMKGDSQASLLKLLADGQRECYNFIYVDGNHTAQGTLEDAVLAWKLLAPDGVMVFDDYLWRNNPIHHTIMSPKLGIDAFVSIYAHKCIVLPGFPINQVYLRKFDIEQWAMNYAKENPNIRPLIEG